MARRRGKQQGSLIEKGPSWIGYWNEWDPAKGKWIKVSQVICPRTIGRRQVTRKQAQRLFDETVLNDLDMYNTHPRSAATVRELWETKYRASLSAGGLQPRGVEFYINVTEKHILPWIGDRRLRDVDFSAVEELIAREREKGLSAATLTHVRNGVTRMFKYAKRLKWYSGDLPTVGVQMPPAQRAERDILTRVQLHGVLEQLEWWTLRDERCVIRVDVRKDGYVPLWELALLLSRTGIRIGEGCGLRWLRVNLTDEALVQGGVVLEPRSIAITNAWVTATKQFGGRQLGPLKTGDKGMRIIPLVGSVVHALRELQAKTGGEPTEFVFQGKSGKPLRHENYAKRVLKPIGEEVGVPWISWHTFRHTANTMARIEQMSIVDRKKVFGWSQDNMAMHYDHAMVEDLRAGLERLDRGLEMTETVQ